MIQDVVSCIRFYQSLLYDKHKHSEESRQSQVANHGRETDACFPYCLAIRVRVNTDCHGMPEATTRMLFFTHSQQSEKQSLVVGNC